MIDQPGELENDDYDSDDSWYEENSGTDFDYEETGDYDSWPDTRDEWTGDQSYGPWYDEEENEPISRLG